MLLFTSNQDLFPPYWLDHCRDNFIEMLRQNYDDKDSTSVIVSQPTLLSNDADNLFSDPLLVDQSAEDTSGNSIEDELGRYLNDGRYKLSTGEDKSPLHWWRDNERRFPRLAQCARNVLAIPGMSTFTIYIIIHLLHDVQDHRLVLNEH